MQIQETANGVAYTRKGTSIVFPYGAEPRISIGGSYDSIERPERFGSWETKAQRRAFVARFFDIPNPAKCDQCVALMINGVFCHETGCPNSRKRR
jgi:hypothetical protein